MEQTEVAELSEATREKLLVLHPDAQLPDFDKEKKTETVSVQAEAEQDDEMAAQNICSSLSFGCTSMRAHFG
jgi:hypothetical protein